MKTNFLLIALLAGSMACNEAGKGHKTEASAPLEESIPTEADIEVPINLEKSTLRWTGKSVGDEHQGFINIKDGSLIFQGEEIKGGTFVLDMNTIKAVMHENEHDSEEKLVKLSGHLKNEDFFNVEKFPEASFVITSAEKLSAPDSLGNNYNIAGNLTIKDISKNISFPAKITKGEKFSANALFNIDRLKWGVSYRSEESWKNKMISPFISLEVHLEAKQ